MDEDQCSISEFSILFSGMQDYWGKKYNPDVLDFYFQGLKQYPVESIRTAAHMHAKSKDGKFFPKLAEFKNILDGDKPNPDQVIAAARLCKTPFGVKCAMHIGSSDLNSQSEYYLRQRAHEILDLYEEWKSAYHNCKISEHTKSVLKKYGISENAHFTKFGEKKPSALMKIESKEQAPKISRKQEARPINDLIKQNGLISSRIDRTNQEAAG